MFGWIFRITKFVEQTASSDLDGFQGNMVHTINIKSLSDKLVPWNIKLSFAIYVPEYDFKVKTNKWEFSPCGYLLKQTKPVLCLPALLKIEF